MKNYLIIFCLVLSSQSSHAKEFKFAIVSNFSSLSSNTLNPFTNSFEEGVQLAVDAINQRSKDCRFVYEKIDNKGDLRSTLKSAREALASKSLAVIGYHSSTTALSVGELFKSGGLTMISPTASANKVFEFGPPIFPLISSNGSQSEVLLYVTKEQKAQKVAILSISDCPYCADFANSYAQKLKAKKIAYKTVSTVESQLISIETVNQILEYNPNLVFIPHYEVFAARLVNKLRDKNYKGGFIGGDSWYNANGKHFFSILGDIELNNRFLGIWHRDIKTSKNKELVRLYRKKYKQDPDTDSALAYDSVQWLYAANKSCPKTREQVITNMKKLKSFDSVVGQINFSKNKKYGFSPLLKYNLKEKKVEFVKLVPTTSAKNW